MGGAAHRFHHPVYMCLDGTFYHWSELQNMYQHQKYILGNNNGLQLCNLDHQFDFLKYLFVPSPEIYVSYHLTLMQSGSIIERKN